MSNAEKIEYAQLRLNAATKQIFAALIDHNDDDWKRHIDLKAAQRNIERAMETLKSLPGGE